MKKRRRPHKGPRRHHFRPVWYLKGFSIAGKPNYCHALNVESGQPLYNTNISKLGVVKDFFRVSNDFAGIEPSTANFDGIVSKVFSDIVLDDGLLCNYNEFQIVKEFIARMMVFDNVVRDTIIKAAKILYPGDIKKNDDVETVPMMISLLPIYREIIDNLNYKLLVADRNNYFICPDAVYFTSARDGELHFYFPLNKNLCLYGSSSDRHIAEFNISTPEINTLLLLHSQRFIYFPDWNITVHNGISGVPIENFKNRGVDNMMKSWIKINNHLVDPGKEPDLNCAIFWNHVPSEAITESHNYINELIAKIETQI